MKDNILKALLLPLFLLVLATSCSDNPSIGGISPDDPVTPEELNALNTLKDVCLQWGESKSSVGSSMHRYSENESDENTLIYSNKESNVFVSYQFKDNKLITAVVTFAKVFGDATLSSRLNNFKYFGKLSGCSLYSNNSANSLCAIYSCKFDDTEYSVVGFTPLESESFEYLEPISVTINEVTSITEKGGIVNCSVTGNPAQAKVGLVVSTDENFADTKSYTATLKDGGFTVSISNLTHDTKYWCQANITAEGVTYTSDIFTFETLHVDTYKVGDLYPKNGTPEGVVFYIEGTGEHGKIVSLDQSGWIEWDVNGFFSPKAGCNNTSDGSKNKMPTSRSPVAQWCYGKGSDWYCPARGELVTLSSATSKVNPTLTSNGYKALENMFWCSTEYSSDCAYIVCVAPSYYMGYSGGWYGYNTKDEKRPTVAVKKF